ncbi:MAG: archaetidylserine decarboxylase [Porticoccaceae bacterium]
MTKQSPSNTRHHRDELFIALQRLLPQHSLSRLLGRFAESERPWLKDFLIRQAVAHYGIDLSEARLKSTTDYPSFNAFFTRHLDDGARPIASGEKVFVSPADGAISQIGDLSAGNIIQAKGFAYSVQSLLGCDEATAATFEQGSFATIYLSPRDYHRVHMPFDGELKSALYVPGKLFSVNDATASRVDGLFARNERLSCLFDTSEGLLAVVMVGALFVAGIESVWQKHYRPRAPQARLFEPKLPLAKGAEMGAFKFGSTVIVVSEKALRWEEKYGPGSACRMGEALGSFE